jgi:hypothetical protein
MKDDKPSKIALVWGATLLCIIIFWFIASLLDMFKQDGFLDPMVATGSSSAVVIGWITTIWLIGSLVYAIWMVAKSRLFTSLVIHASIPAYFVFAFFPIAVGIGLVALTGLSNWGAWLTCLSFPTLLVLLLLAIHKASG